jgi:MFS family permease
MVIMGKHRPVPSKWLNIGGSLMFGLFVSYLDRNVLSVSITQVSHDLGFSGAHFAMTSSLALTIFLMGYAVANILGGFLTRGMDPKWVVINCFLLWSIATIVAGATASVSVLLACRLILGVAEGIYWPQQSRFARTWFSVPERAKANGLIQYYGQYGGLALGYLILTPLDHIFGWRVLFYIIGGIGIICVVPLFLLALPVERDTPALARPPAPDTKRLRFADFGGAPFLLLVVSYFTQGMLFWGITLWIPLVVRSLGFTGYSQAFASAVPFAAAILFAIPMTRLSDRTQKHVLIAGLGQIIPGILLLCLPIIESPSVKLALITVALGYYASSYTPNIWAILQSSVQPKAVGPASGIINGVGAGGGGTIAGFLVAFMDKATGSYMSGFMVLGIFVILGGFCLLAYGGIIKRHLRYQTRLLA